MDGYIKSGIAGTDRIYLLPFNFIPNAISNEKFKNNTIRCMKSLIVSKHFQLVIDNGEHFISITQKGLVNRDFFKADN
jgi:hypothetical protein